MNVLNRVDDLVSDKGVMPIAPMGATPKKHGFSCLKQVAARGVYSIDAPCSTVSQVCYGFEYGTYSRRQRNIMNTKGCLLRGS